MRSDRRSSGPGRGSDEDDATFSDQEGVAATEGIHGALQLDGVLQVFECALVWCGVVFANRKYGAGEAVVMGTSMSRPDDQAKASLLSSNSAAADDLQLLPSPPFGEAKVEDNTFVGAGGGQGPPSRRRVNPKWSKMVIWSQYGRLERRSEGGVGGRK